MSLDILRVWFPTVADALTGMHASNSNFFC